jgi:hypothetical protein
MGKKYREINIIKNPQEQQDLTFIFIFAIEYNNGVLKFIADKSSSKLYRCLNGKRSMSILPFSPFQSSLAVEVPAEASPPPSSVIV